MMKNGQRGFTFVEMGIVLIIIGIILASVMKATDIYHSAQIDKVNKVFFEAWKTVVYEYYDRRGQYLGDGRENGGFFLPPPGDPDGRFDGFLAATQTLLDPNIIEVARDAGIDICGIIQSNTPVGAYTSETCSDYDIFQREVSGSFAYKGAPVQVGFYSYEIDGVFRNCLVFTNVPIDVAQRLSKYYDGVADGMQGSVRVMQGVTGTALPSPPLSNGASPSWQKFFDGVRDNRYNLVMILQF